MYIANVTTSSTIIIPEEGTEEFQHLYDSWWADEGFFLWQDDRTTYTGTLLYKVLALYIDTENNVGNFTHLLSSQETNVTLENIKNQEV